MHEKCQKLLLFNFILDKTFIIVIATHNYFKN